MKKTGYTIKCENCGKEIYQTKTQYNRAKHHFCSNTCQKEFSHKELSEHRKCEICGKDMYLLKSSPKRFCCSKCQNEWQKTQIGKLNTRYNRKKCKCDYCNKEIEIIKANVERYNHHFCSDICRVNWYGHIFSQSNEWKEESRIRGASLLSKNIATTMTKPQIIINNILDEMKIKYKNEYQMDYYSMDNYLCEYNLIIEVMGDFWHCNPIKYKSVEKDIQKKRVPKDKAKHTFIKNKYNIEILYLWETDIYNNFELCENLIAEYIQNNGKLLNYHSFNYEIKNNKLSQKEVYIKAYFDEDLQLMPNHLIAI